MNRSRSFEKSRKKEDCQWGGVGRLSMLENQTEVKSKVSLSQWCKKFFISSVRRNSGKNFNLRMGKCNIPYPLKHVVPCQLGHIKFLNALFVVSYCQLRLIE